MLKIFKVLVTGIENQDGIGINSTVRTTMGYDQTKKEISLLVEKVNLPEVPTDKTVELRDPHTTATFTTLLSRTFTPDDFPKTSEMKRWQVDYDVIKNELVIFDAVEYGLDKITNSQSARKIARYVKERYNHDLIPVFALDNVYKSATDFDASVLTFYTDEQGLDINDTILTGAAADAETVTQQEKEFWVVGNVNTVVYFEVLDNDGKILSSSIPTVKPASKSSNFITQTFMNIDEDNVLPAGRNQSGNQYKVSLPVSNSYNIRIVYSRHLGEYLSNGRTIPCTFDIDCVNGISNKTRTICGGITENIKNMYVEQHVVKPANQATVSGLDNVRISTNGLSAGDYIKLKLNLGNFKSYAELWIELT
jgi:hypothetical protein